MRRLQLDDNSSNEPRVQGENVRSASAGSMHSVGKVTEDVAESEPTTAASFMGKTSEVDWMRNLRNKVQGDSGTLESRNGLAGGHSERATLENSTYNLEDDDLMDLASVDPHSVPTPEEITTLLDEYFNVVQPQFPFIGKLNFRHQMRSFLGWDNHKPARPSRKWFAVMNLVFAVAAKHMELIGTAFPAEHLHHRVFFARARILGLGTETYFEAPTLQRIQILGMAALYLMTLNQVNRYDPLQSQMRI